MSKTKTLIGTPDPIPSIRKARLTWIAQTLRSSIRLTRDKR